MNHALGPSAWQRTLWASGLALLTLMVWTLLGDAAYAQANPSAGNFSCSQGTASGSLFNSNASCPTTLRMDNVFSYLICNMEQLSSNLMGTMYCGMIYNLSPMVMAALSFATFVFGVGFTTGIIPATAREFQKFLLKISLVYVFATGAEYLIGFGYRFLIVGTREGIQIVLAGMYTDPIKGVPTGGGNIYSQLDNFLKQAIHLATDTMDGNPENRCKNAVFGALAVMAIAFPPVFYIGLLIMFKIAVTFLRAVFGYCYAIIGIAFLLTLAPFFLSFYLFMQTRSMFDKWLGYLVSFALQIVILFAFLTFVVSINVKNITSDLTNIIIPVEETQESTAVRLPWKYCTLCEFEMVQKDADGNVIGVIPEDQYKDIIAGAGLRCKDNPPKPIKALSAISPEGGNAPNQELQNKLLRFTGTGLLSLYILAVVVNGVLNFVPQLAKIVAAGMGGFYAPQLGGGQANGPVLDAPGFGRGGMADSFVAGFNRGFGTSRNSDGSAVPFNSISRTAEGMKQGMRKMVTGKASDADQQNSGTLIDRFTRYLINPMGDNH